MWVVVGGDEVGECGERQRMEQQRAHENNWGFPTARWARVPESIEAIITNTMSGWIKENVKH
jgi:hypothetical protein